MSGRQFGSMLAWIVAGWIVGVATCLLLVEYERRPEFYGGAFGLAGCALGAFGYSAWLNRP